MKVGDLVVKIMLIDWKACEGLSFLLISAETGDRHTIGSVTHKNRIISLQEFLEIDESR